MIKNLAILLFSCLLFGINVNANEVATAQSTNTEYIYGIEDNYDFENNSYNISDEQLKDLENLEKIDDDNAGFLHKIINSSHFSSGTATRTWIPINKKK